MYCRQQVVTQVMGNLQQQQQQQQQQQDMEGAVGWGVAYHTAMRVAQLL